MFTDAVANILNPQPYTMLHSFSYSALMDIATPLWEQVLGGVMLLSTPVAETADNIFLPADAVPLATAGGGYSGDDVWRGTINLNESYPLDNGYHFTWDFATDKANGTIACVALTSKSFASSGFNCVANTSNGGKLILNHQSPVNDPNAGYFTYTYGQYVGTFEPNVHLFVYKMDKDLLMFTKVRSVDPSALTILDECGCADIAEPFARESLSLPFDISSDCLFYVEDGVMYYFSTVDDTAGGITEVEYAGIDVHTLTMTQQGSFTMIHNGGSLDVGAVHGGYIWVATHECLAKCNATGAVVKKHKLSANGGRFVNIGGRLLYKIGELIYDIEGDDMLMMYTAQPLVPAANVDIKPPYIALTERIGHTALGESYTNRPVVGIMGNYLATINNLAVPITKTSDQVLKVSYDITNS